MKSGEADTAGPSDADLHPLAPNHWIYRYLRLLDSTATSDEKSTYPAREKLRGKRRESSVETRDGR